MVVPIQATSRPKVQRRTGLTSATNLVKVSINPNLNINLKGQPIFGENNALTLRVNQQIFFIPDRKLFSFFSHATVCFK
jgi:hypothetical protein